MGIDMSTYKMVYQNKVYNCISLMIYWTDSKIDKLQVFYIDADNRVAYITDNASTIQFISK